MRCSKCGTESTSGRKFCPECGSPLSNPCTKCGADNSPTAKFCEDCGASLKVASAASAKKSSDLPIRVAETSASENLEGERKVVTFLFADLKGSMDLMEDLDPEEARAIVDPALKLMIEAVHHYGGYVAQPTGDGVFALFGAPIAHEDHPQRALFAALRLQEEMRRYSAKLRQAGNLPLEARVGVNTGEVVVRSIATGQGNVEYAPIGHSTGLAARMQALAPTGSIAATDAVRKLCEGYFTFKTLGPTKVKGVTEPIDVYEVTGFGPLRTRLQVSAQRGLTKFVGRERETEQMHRALELANAGQGQIVAAVAEPGVGKSRLFFEFRATLTSSVLVLEAHPVSHGKASPYLALVEFLNGYFEISSEDDAHRRRLKIRRKVLDLDRALEDTLPYVFSLMGAAEEADSFAQMDPQMRRGRMLDGAKRILFRESGHQPLILVFEDLHWIDGETLGFLNLLADSIGTARILMLVNYRPELRHEWGNKSYYTQLSLNPLGRNSAEEMLSALLGDGKDLVPLKRHITQKTEGNPFFIEEIVQTLFEQGVLARNGAVKLAKSLSEIGIPTTVQGVLASRIDRLPPDARELLQTLAVIGKEFTVTLVGAVTTKAEDELARMLADLQLAEFIYEQPSFPDTAYIFKHALTQDVAYNSVLIGRRKVLHERTGEAMEALYGGRPDDHLSALAHHFSQSRNTRKAIHYSRLAGVQAAQRSVNRESVAYLRSALDLLKSLPETLERKREELDLLVMLGPLMMTLSGHGAREPEEFYVRARALCRELGDNTRLFPVLWGLWMSHNTRPELNEARVMADELMSVAEALGENTLILEAHHSMWASLILRGELREAWLHTERGGELYNPREHGALASLYGGHDPGVCRKHHAARLLWLFGYPDQALKSGEEALALAQELTHPNSLAQALTIVAMIEQFRRDRIATRARADAAIALSAEHGFAQWGPIGMILRGWSESGDARTRERGLVNMREALSAYRAQVTRFHLPYFLALTADICSELGRPDQALELIVEALELVDRTGERWHESELHRLGGELSLLRDSPSVSTAEASFRTAIEIARKQAAKSLELRSTMSLARILAKRGDRNEARAMLAEIYGWFTEGFDTADLKDAKALLDELSN